MTPISSRLSRQDFAAKCQVGSAPTRGGRLKSKSLSSHWLQATATGRNAPFADLRRVLLSHEEGVTTRRTQ